MLDRRMIQSHNKNMSFISQPSKAGLARRAASQYARGTNPCAHCSSSRHKECRPKLDNTLCSCECPKADRMRQAVADMQTNQTIEGAIPSVEVCVIALAPKMRRMMFGNGPLDGVERT